MAHSLKLEVTAEGVENEAQYQFIRELGCEQYQGFLCSAPVSPEAFIETLRATLSPTQRLRVLAKRVTDAPFSLPPRQIDRRRRRAAS